MLGEKVRTTVSWVMTVGCFLRIYPYVWDPEKYRLRTATKFDLFIHHVNQGFLLFTIGFMGFRIFQTQNEDVPPRIRIMNFVWIMAYGIVALNNFQFNLRRVDIMAFSNALLEYREEQRRVLLGKGQGKTDLETGRDWTSIIVLASTALLFFNPPAHAVVIFTSPCAPQYWSSLYFPCKSYAEIAGSVLEAFPFFLWELFMIAHMMTNLYFNYVMVFLGIKWIQDCNGNDELRDKSLGPVEARNRYLDNVVARFRYGQIQTVILNDAFSLYLQWYPCVVFTIAGTLIFATIKYYNVPIHSYIVFPLCGIRCIIESSTCIAVAGHLNATSKEFLNKWDTTLCLGDKTSTLVKCHRAIRRSCVSLKCCAGSLYTFEKSILLISLHHCFQVTLNLLLTYNQEVGI